MTLRGMYGSWCRIGTTVTIIVRPPPEAIRVDQGRARAGCFAAAAGSATPRGAVRRIASGFRRGTATTAWAFAF